MKTQEVIELLEKKRLKIFRRYEMRRLLYICCNPPELEREAEALATSRRLTAAIDAAIERLRGEEHDG